MSTNYICITGRLGQDPRPIETASGKPMAVCSLAVDLDTRDNRRTVWFGVIAFGDWAKDLQQLIKGDSLCVSGKLQLNVYQGRDGEVEQLQVVADSLISAGLSRPVSKGRDRFPPPVIQPGPPPYERAPDYDLGFDGDSEVPF